MRETKVSKSVSCDYMCRLTLYFTRSTNTHEDGNVFLRAVCPQTLAVCFYWDVTKCLRLCAWVRLEHVKPEGRASDEKSRRLYRYPCHVS